MSIKALNAARFGAAVSLLGFALTPAAYAATATSQFQVTATIISSCTISAGDMAFGNYDPAATSNTDATSTITVTCTNGAAYNVLLNGGNSGTVAARTMEAATGTQFLSYQLYSDAAYATVWGETIGTDSVAGTGSGAAQNMTVYGRIPAGQTTPTVGTYTDKITATIDF